MEKKLKAARLSVLSNTLLVFLKLVTGIVMGSISVLSEAIHSGIDLMAALISFYSIREAAKPADESHPYGHGKIENVSGTIEAILIFVAALVIIYKALQKLAAVQPVDQLGPGIVIMAISALVNYFISRHLFRVAQESDSVALRADAWHLRTDVWTSAGVMAGLALIAFSGWNVVDPLIAMAVSFFIIKAAFDLTRDAFFNILDVRLPREDLASIQKILKLHASEFVEYHKLRTRKSGGERHVDLHLVVRKDRNIEDVHNLCNRIEADIKASLPNVNVLIHLEPCSQYCSVCDPKCEQGDKRNGETHA